MFLFASEQHSNEHNADALDGRDKATHVAIMLPLLEMETFDVQTKLPTNSQIRIGGPKWFSQFSQFHIQMSGRQDAIDQVQSRMTETAPWKLKKAECESSWSCSSSPSWFGMCPVANPAHHCDRLGSSSRPCAVGGCAAGSYGLSLGAGKQPSMSL